MLEIGSYYFGFTVHVAKSFICNQIGNVDDCNILTSQSLNTDIELFQILYPLDVIFESDEEKEPFHTDQHEKV